MIFTVTLNPAIDREYTVPDLRFSDVLRASSTRNDAGGKGFNVSRMLAVLGQPSTAIAFGAGKSGEWLESSLAGLGITTDFIWVDGETRTNTTVVTGTGDDYLKVNEAGPQISADAQSYLLEKIDTLAQPGDWWVLAGSLPPGVPAEFYGEMIDRLKQHGAMVFLDTSGPALSASLSHIPNWIKPNEHEAAEITGHADPSLAAEQLLAAGVGQVAITLGGDGVLLATADGVNRLAPPKIVEANPIGAGDAFVGGTVFGLAQELPSAEAIRWGIACGATAASLPGTDFGTREMIEQRLIEVESLNQIS